MSIRQGAAPPIAALHQLLDYDPEGGALRWRVDRPQAASGALAGSLDRDGYRRITLTVDGVRYRIYAHRVAWAMSYGVYPQELIDHIDGDPGNNRLSNLRQATHAQNMANMRSKLRTKNPGLPRGVALGPGMRTRPYAARIKHGGRRLHLGYFATPEEAGRAYDMAAAQFKGDFAVLNNVLSHLRSEDE